MRGAALAAGGAAVYHAGKRSQAGQDSQAYEDASQDAQLQQLQQQQAVPAAPPAAAPAPAAPAGGITQDSMAELERLGKLHADGILTDEEFAAAKAKVLGT
jgi:hypothetical protein